MFFILEKNVFQTRGGVIFTNFLLRSNQLEKALFEICKNPAIQRRVQREIDDLNALLDAEKREMVYDDLQRLPYLSRVVSYSLYTYIVRIDDLTLQWSGKFRSQVP